ncbi:MAG: excinuclease ABC subunit UvrB [Clostridia bacterium]
MEKRKFELKSDYQPAGDQPQAIKELAEGIENGLASQVLLGVTGSGKTFTMANIIKKVNRPTLVIAHNKVLAAQLCNEFRQFFPNNRVEFFVSYYDYYQPEAYIAQTDTYIEKDMAINDEIDKLRNSATSSLLERSDTIVVASVSCIYGLGNPEEYLNLQISLREGDKISRNDVIKKLIAVQYVRSDIDFKRATFRAKGDILDIFPSSSNEIAIRISFLGNQIENIGEIEAISGKQITSLKHVSIYPATHYAVGSAKMENALAQIALDRDRQVEYFKKEGKIIEAQRIKERATYDIEMMREVGYCSGVENYSRYFDGRKEGEAPFTLMDYFPKGYLTLIDESHMTIPQIKAMYAGDKARKLALVNFGFRLPSAFDNRPLCFEEFNKRVGQTIFISATPALYEKQKAGQIVEQLIRPTGLLDPIIEVKPTQNQIDDLLAQIINTTSRGFRTLVTTLTKKMAESLSAYLGERSIKVRYLHSEIDTMERIEILNGLRAGDFDVLVGINLLREGLDLPEVELVCILDADKEGFLRSTGALIQTIGRVARNENGKAIMYADKITNAMKEAIYETDRRRKIQEQYNIENNIIPKTIQKQISNSLMITQKSKIQISKDEIPKEIEHLKALMQIASSQLDFETAIELRTQISDLKKMIK